MAQVLEVIGLNKNDEKVGFGLDIRPELVKIIYKYLSIISSNI